MSKFSSISINIHMQRHLLPALEEEIGVLSSKEKQFVRILELVDIHPFLADPCWLRNRTSAAQPRGVGPKR